MQTPKLKWGSAVLFLALVLLFFCLQLQQRPDTVPLTILDKSASILPMTPGPLRREVEFDWDAGRLDTECATLLEVASFGHPVPLLENLLRSVAFKTSRFEYTIVTVANYGNLPLLLNWIKSMRVKMHNQDKFVVICLDEALQEELTKRRVPTLLANALLRHDSELGLAKKFAQHGLDDIARFKIRIVYILMRYYRLNVLYSDADLAMTDPKLFDWFDILFAEYELHDMIFATHTKIPPQVNTAFFASRNSAFALRLLGMIVVNPDFSTRIDQDIMNGYLFRMNKPELLHVHYLDQRYFTSDATLLRKDGVEPFMFQADSGVGVEAKIKLLKQAGYWFLDRAEEREAFQ